MKRAKVIIIAAVAILSLVFCGTAEKQTVLEPVFVYCQPDSYVVIRSTPRKRNNEVEYGIAGEMLLTDWKVKNGYLHVIGGFEAGEGWIKQEYVSIWEPYVYQSGHEFRVITKYANCRKWMNGPKKGSVKKGTIIKVFVEGEEWCVTNFGYISAKCLEEVTE